MDPKKLWKLHRLAEGKTLFFQVGPLQLWVQRSGSEWRVAERRLSKQCKECTLSTVASAPKGISFRSWAFTQNFEDIRLLPCLPDRPLVVKTLTTRIIPPKKETIFFLSLPLYGELSVGKDSQHWVLTEVPSSILSHTWIGDFFEGEGGYALKTPASYALEDVNMLPNRVICSLRVTNQGEKPLPIEKMCIRPEFLEIYATTQSLWTNEMQATFRSTKQAISIRYLPGAPTSPTKAVLLRPAAKKSKRNFLQRAFGSYVAYFSDA